MQKPQSTPESKNHNNKNQQPQERRQKSRRKVNCDGYTYIPMVGWYCRRAKARREDLDNQ